MTNAELNLAIAKLVYPDARSVTINSNDGVDVMLFDMIGGKISGQVTVVINDYLNNWNDLMPLVVEYKISLVYLGHDRWKSESDWDFEKDSSIEILGVPQRALAECLLKVLEDKQ